MLSNKITAAVLAATFVSAVAMAAPAQAAEEAPAKEKCFGVAMKGQNDCKSGAGTSCAGSSTVNYDGHAFKLVPAGSCLKMGGTLEAHEGHAAPVPMAADHK